MPFSGTRRQQAHDWEQPKVGPGTLSHLPVPTDRQVGFMWKFLSSVRAILLGTLAPIFPLTILHRLPQQSYN